MTGTVSGGVKLWQRVKHFYKGYEVLESHDLPSSERTWHIKEAVFVLERFTSSSTYSNEKWKYDIWKELLISYIPFFHLKVMDTPVVHIISVVTDYRHFNYVFRCMQGFLLKANFQKHFAKDHSIYLHYINVLEGKCKTYSEILRCQSVMKKLRP